LQSRSFAFSPTQSGDYAERSDKGDKKICTSVILPLRIPQLYSNFGFIDFESEQCIEKSDEPVKLFMKIAETFVLDYISKNMKVTP
jgi:hypothetical protein